MTDVSDALESTEEETKGPSWSRIALLLFLAGILLLLFWLGWKAWRIYDASSSLLARQAEIEQLTDGGWQQKDPDELEALVFGIRADSVALMNEIDFLMPLVPVLSTLPEIGPLAAASPALLEMVDAGTAAAAYGFRGMKPALAAIQDEESSEPLIPTLVDTVDNARPDLAMALTELDRVADAHAQIDNVESLPWRIRTLIEQGDEWLPLGQDFLRLSLVLPEMMGKNGQRRYLILAQNQDELRPAGGFISGAGYLEVEDGQITGLDFVDANFVDAWEFGDWAGGKLEKPYAEPPQPLQDYMLLDLFLFRDANFWPDFAVSGQKAMDLYAYGREIPPLDGAIGINQQFLQNLLGGMGPVSISETGEEINSGNIIESLQQAWTLQDGVIDRKAFLGTFALAMLSHLDSGFENSDPLHLVQQLSQSLKQKDLQIYTRDPQAAALLAANNWDGRLPHPTNSDTLMIVDTNVGYNKANFLVDRSVEYAVQLAEEGGSVANLGITHTHQGQAGEEPCWQGTSDEYRAGESYLALTDKCYWNYMRVYTPEGSQLNFAPQNLIPGDTWFGGYDVEHESQSLSELPGYTTFDTHFLLPQGQSITNEFQYTLPDSVIHTGEESSLYRLHLSKQAGVHPYHVQLSITVPPGKTVVDSYPDPVAIENNTVIYSINLDGDRTVAIAYR